MLAIRRTVVFISLISLLVLGCGCSSTTTAQQSKERLGQAATESTMHTAPKVPAANLPVRLIIPAIQVDAAIEPVGVLSSGDLATPEQQPWVDAGWYTSGPHPGEPGSAVIDGHLDRPGGYPAVFWNLHEMHAGEIVKVKMASGKLLLFHVTHTAFYTPQEAPLQAIFGNGSGKYLNLITCAGDWISSEQQTTQRMVVFTSLG